MTIRSDYTLLNDASTAGDWNTGGSNAPDSPLLNNSSSTVPYYIQSTSCMEFALKSNADGYTYDGVTNLDFTNKLFVWWHWFPGPDIAGLPLNTFALRFSDAAGFTTDFEQWDVKPQLAARPGSFVPLKVWPTNPDATNGTPDNANVSSYGLVVATGGTDNKAAAFDHIFNISELGGHSATYTETLFDLMYTGEAESNVEKVIGIWEKAGEFYQSNVQIAIGNDVAANTIVTESNKTVFFDNVEPEQELGYVFYGGSTGQVSLTLNSVVHFWNSQQSTHEIFKQVSEVDDFQIDGSAFTNGGRVTLPADAVGRHVRNTKFDNCQAGTASDGEFTVNTWVNCPAFTVSGDADLSGTSFLTPNVAINTSGLIWNGNFDTNGNLDGCNFSKGATAHHALELGTASPLTVTLTNVGFTGFNALSGQNDSTIHVKRTSGTVTINVTGGDTPSYRSDGATVVVNAGKTLTITNIIVGSEVRIYDDAAGAGPNTELDGVESIGSTSFVYAHDGTANDIIIQIIEPGYVEIYRTFAITNNNQTFQANQEVETNG